MNNYTVGTETNPELTLDPQDWDAMRLLGHRMLDEMLDYLKTVKERPVWQPFPPQVDQARESARNAHTVTTKCNFLIGNMISSLLLN